MDEETEFKGKDEKAKIKITSLWSTHSFKS